MIRKILFLSCFLFYLSCAKNKIIDYCNCLTNFGTSQTLDIITWNIEWFPKEGNLTIDYLVEIINSMEVDIIAMQEIWGASAQSNFEILIDKLDNWSGHRKSTGLAYLYKKDIIINSISEINELNDIIRTPYLLSINYNNQDIFIINNHFKANESGQSDEIQRQLASQMIHSYINLNLLNENVIILGDLNDELNEDFNQNVFLDFINDSTNFMFVDMNIANGSALDWSYPSYPSHIDHIIISNELYDEFQKGNSYVRTIKIDDFFEGYDKYISDHRPVGLRLNFN